MRPMDGSIAWRAALILGVAVAVVAVVLGAALPREFFEDYGWAAGPAVWAGCALLTAAVLRLPLVPALAGAALVVFSFSPRLWLALPALYLVGMGMLLSAASTNTVLQSIVPDELRGRVASLYVVAFIGVSPIGALLSGWLAEHFGPPATLAGCGVLTLAAALFYASRLAAIRREIRPVYEQMGIISTDTALRQDQ